MFMFIILLFLFYLYSLILSALTVFYVILFAFNYFKYFGNFLYFKNCIIYIMFEIIVVVLLFFCFCIDFYIIYRIVKDDREQLNNTGYTILDEIKTDDNDNTDETKTDDNKENDKTINEFYTEQPTIIFNDMFQYSEPWRNQLNNDKNNTLEKNT